MKSSALERLAFADALDLAPDAIDDDSPFAVLPHEQAVVGLLDARLPDDGAAGEPLELPTGQLGVGDFAHVPE